jgi:hypothetical protein
MSTTVDASLQRMERDRQRAEAAFWDYYNLGVGRTIKALYEDYTSDERKQDPTVPSRHKNDLSRWRREYEWDKRIFDLEREALERDAQSYNKVRLARLNKLATYSADAVDTLHRLATNSTGKVPERIQLAAADSILNRIGVSEKTTTAPAESATNAPPPPPAPDAPASEWERYYSTYKN